VIVSNATTPQQQFRWTTVGNLAGEAKLPAPALLIVGRVATHEIQELATTHWRGETDKRHPKRTTIS
jgi:siroheme synthase